MWLKRQVEIAEPETEPPFSREQALIDELHEVDRARDRIYESMKDFRQRHTATVDGRLMYQVSAFNERPKLDELWRGLVLADTKLIESRNRILRDLAQIRCPYVS